MIKLLIITILLAILSGGCQSHSMAKKKLNNEVVESSSIAPDVASIKEVYRTFHDPSANVDSPAVWNNPDGSTWLLATAKEGNMIIVYNAATGEKITTFCEAGEGAGQLSRPNGIAVTDNLAMVVERDNHRIQIFSLPGFRSLGIFGGELLKKPYGIAADFFEGKYHLFVTDNYEMPDETTPPADSLGRRVHHFTFTVENDSILAEHLKAFGDTAGDGALFTVESILIDRNLDRLLIADENEERRNIKIYNTEGEFTELIIPGKYFLYEPEGIAMWSCNKDNSGYYIAVDQGTENNTFQVFDRKTTAYIGGFSGLVTRNTDGVALTQSSFGEFNDGAFFPVHDDGSITAINWDDIAGTLGLRSNCD